MTQTYVGAEIASQPDTWREVIPLLDDARESLPRSGARVAVVGCGTSWFIAQAYAALREDAGHGETDAFTASEFPHGRSYDHVVALSRSGETTEIIELLARVTAATSLVTAVPDSTATRFADAVVALPFADERSVVQTRFATTALALFRGTLGEDLDRLAVDAETALALDHEPLLEVDQVTFVGTGWTIGLCAEAALKTREAAQFWAESYPAMDYRHGPIAIAQAGRLVWSFGPEPRGLREEVERTGARFVRHDLDPLAALIVAQRFAVAQAERRWLDPDRPRSLSRAVVLDEA